MKHSFKNSPCFITSALHAGIYIILLSGVTYFYLEAFRYESGQFPEVKVVFEHFNCLLRRILDPELKHGRLLRELSFNHLALEGFRN
jgi:hypothetical protein